MKQFLVILGLTALVWLGVSLSEPTEYPVDVRVTYTGYDSVRYAMLRADTTVTLRVTTSGFVAILYHAQQYRPGLVLSVGDGALRYATPMKEVCDQFVRSHSSIQSASGSADSLRLVLAPRAGRAFRPTLEHVDFDFAEQYGLYGEPVITPSEVTLYGPQEALERVKELPLKATSISGISASGHYRLELEPVWEAVGDLHPSQTSVDLYLPVEAYVERDYRVPIRVAGADSTVQLRLYPKEVTLHVWIAQRDLHRTPDFAVGIDYGDILSHSAHIAPRLLQFPSYIRPRSIEPAEVQCVVIK